MTDPSEQLLAPYASRPSRSKGRIIAEDPSGHRNAFQRDRDRIIHSTAFRRLKNKTQVFIASNGDHFRTRLTHSLEVAQIARSLARSLNVQEDLAEAIALAHDLGHPPFAHSGEDALQDCLHKFGGFNHNDQSLRIVSHLERRYAEFDGLNLSWEILEGLAKHNGPVLSDPLPPTMSELNVQCDLQLSTWPSLEAQLANLSDDIAYNSHDIDDGLRAGFFKAQDLAGIPFFGDFVREVQGKYPKLERTRLANEIVRRMLGAMVADVLCETRSRLARLNPAHPDDLRMAAEPVAAFSPHVLAAVTELRQFLMAQLYRHAKVNRLRHKTMTIVKDLFTLLFAEPTCLPMEWQMRLRDAGEGEAMRARIVLDYVAGMTDRFAIAEHHRLFDPYTIEGLPSV